MRAAALAGKLQREQQFMMGFDADKLYPEVTHGDMVLVQGIMIAWFWEDDEVVLVDYKDRSCQKRSPGAGRQIPDPAGVLCGGTGACDGAYGPGKDYLFRPQTGLYPGVIFRGFDNF